MMNEQQAYAGQDVEGCNTDGCPFIHQTIDNLGFDAEQIASIEKVLGPEWRKLIAQA